MLHRMIRARGWLPQMDIAVQDDRAGWRAQDAVDPFLTEKASR